MVLFLVHQGYQVFPGAQDPRDPRASQGHPVLVVLRDHKGTRATQERRETKASQVNRDPQENWDLKGPQAGRVPVEPKVMQGIKEDREPQASGVLQELSGFQKFERWKGHWLDKGTSVFISINRNFTKLYLTSLLKLTIPIRFWLKGDRVMQQAKIVFLWQKVETVKINLK